jgi:Tol biopolymer transport system component
LLLQGWSAGCSNPPPPPEPKQVMRSDYELPEDQQFNSFSVNSVIAISPDGKQIVYSTREGLYLRSLDELDARLIPGTTDENPLSPFFSPNGQWVGYWSMTDGQLKKVAIGGGASKVLCDAELVLGATWYPNNTIIYAELFIGSISRVSADGGTPEQLVLNEGPNVDVPQLLPDGKTLLFTSGETGAYKIVLKSLETEDRKELFAGQAARYLPTGQIVYALDDNLYARPFDLGTLGVGDPVHKVSGVLRWEISDSGTMIYIPGRSTSDTTSPVPPLTLFWVDRQGKVEEIPALPNAYSQFKISPDGKKVAVTVSTGEGSSDIHILDLNSGIPNRLTFNGNSNNPLWTPDSQRIVFLSGEGDERSIYCKNADGAGKTELLFSMPEGYFFLPLSWADDGKTMVATKRGSMRMWQSGMRGRGPAPKRASDSEGSSTNEETGSGMDIGTLSMEGEHEWTPLLNLKGWVNDLQISPDRKWMAYISNESGAFEIYVRPFPEVESSGPWQVTDGANGNGFKWSQDGRELFYFQLGSLKVVEVETEPTFKPGMSKVIFKLGGDIGLSLPDIINRANLNISPNDERFLMLKQIETAADESQTEESTTGRPRKIIFVVNWFEELKEKVPVE